MVCPWHKWCFSLHDGHTIRPEGHSETLAVHPVRLDDHNRVCVGFNSFNQLPLHINFLQNTIYSSCKSLLHCLCSPSCVHVSIPNDQIPIN